MSGPETARADSQETQAVQIDAPYRNEALADDAVARLQTRLGALEKFRAESEGAIDQVVTALLDERQSREQAVTAIADAIQGFETLFHTLTERLDLDTVRADLAHLARQIEVDRINADLTHTSRIHPKGATLTFACGSTFGCNLKYAWLEACAKAKSFGWDVWFLPRDAQQEALARSLGAQVFPLRHEAWTDGHVKKALSTAVLVLNDHFLHPNPHASALFAGARQVQLWHGVSIKELGLQNLPDGPGLTVAAARTLATTGPYARFVGTASQAEPEWRRWFAFDRYSAVGYPRNDVLHREPTRADLTGCDQTAYAAMRTARRRGRRVVLYAPTFRDSDRRWMDRLPLETLDEAIRAADGLLVVQLHPRDREQIPEMIRRLPAAILIQPGTDTAPLLREATVLVTDYSSVMFDFLHLDRPILFFRPDHATYVARSRALFDAKLAELPGPVFADVDTLGAALARPEAGQTMEHIQTRSALRATLFDHHDGHSADRLMGLLQEELMAALQPGSKT